MKSQTTKDIDSVKLRRTTLIAAALCAAGLTGCSVATPDTSQVAMHYSGGAFSSQAFQDCVPPGVRALDGPGDYHYFYPQGQRTFTFSDTPGADAPPIRVSTRNQTELIVRGTVTFTLNTDCRELTDPDGRVWPGGMLQRFHDTIGRHKNAYATDGGETQPDGWRDVIGLYVGGPAEKAMDNAGLSYEWQDLYSNATTKATWERTVVEELPKLILAQVGAQHIIVNNVQVQKPDVPQALRAELDANQAAVLRQNTANTDKSAAESFPGGIQGYLAYQQQLAVNDAIKSGRVPILPIPQGSSVIVAPPGQR